MPLAEAVLSQCPFRAKANGKEVHPMTCHGHSHSELWPSHSTKVRHPVLYPKEKKSSLGTTYIQRMVQTKGTDIFLGRRPA